MAPELPPPDPNESLELSPEAGLEVTDPTAVFAAGPPSPATDRHAGAFLALRPGTLIVLVR